ncbi:MAG: NAD-dependent epimerase/dehydratase family protein [Candidatus Caenarcaniphilales bacterium]|nr:NAD-dependent epimerase/dehydratase family protein [Candidatus Caenarcaniphilales bacterium]
MAKKKVLVFGGNRFVGIHLLRELAARPDEYDVFAITRSGVYPSLNIRNLQLDRRYESDIAQKVPPLDYDIAFDLSAYQVGDLQPSLSYLASRVATWVFVSSAGVYAKSETFPLTKSHFKTDQQPHLGKLECEQLLSSYRNFHYLILRPLYIYGTENSFKRETAIFHALEEGKTIYIPNDGSALLQFVEVRDLIRLMLELANLPADIALGQIYHPAMSKLYTLNGLIDVIATVVGIKPNLKYISKVECQLLGKTFRDLFPWRSEHYFADISNLTALGLRTEISLEEGMYDAYQHYLLHKDDL